VFRQAGFSVAIWANHLVRSAAAAMQQTARQLAAEQTLLNLEDRIVPVAEIFRLQGDAELEEAEKRYLPGAGKKVSAVILAASRGKELGALTESLPKALLPVGGKPLLYRQVDTLNEVGVKDITVVRGFRKELISAPNLRYADNDAYESTQELASLRRGLEKAAGATLVSYGDILYKKFIPELLLAADDDILLAVDSDWEPRRREDRYGDFVACDRPYKKERFDHDARLLKMGPPRALPATETHGEWIGLMKLSAKGLEAVKAALTELQKRPDFNKLRMAELLNELVRAGQTVKVQYVRGHWLDVDDISDLSAAGSF
jgi:phosphoenolpyruvate phosphomutase